MGLVTSAAPQGSVVGPVPFHIFIFIKDGDEGMEDTLRKLQTQLGDVDLLEDTLRKLQTQLGDVDLLEGRKAL